MKTIKELLKYEVNKKFVVFTIILLLFNILIDKINFNHFYWYVLIISADYYLLKYMLLNLNA